MSGLWWQVAFWIIVTGTAFAFWTLYDWAGKWMGHIMLSLLLGTVLMTDRKTKEDDHV